MPRPISISPRVYESLKNDICELRRKPGEALVEATLAEQLEVSRTPVREALRMLAADGLVLLVHGKGAFVAPLSLTDVDQFFTVREALECTAARLATNRIPDHVVAALEGRLTRSIAALPVESGEVDPVDEIHDIILSFSGNELIKQLLDTIRGPMRRLHNCAISLGGRPERSLREHVSIWEAVKARDAEAAEVRMRDHLESTKSSIVESWLPMGEYEMEDLLRQHGPVESSAARR